MGSALRARAGDCIFSQRMVGLLRATLLLVAVVQLGAVPDGEVVPLSPDDAALAGQPAKESQRTGEDSSEDAIFGLLDKALGVQASHDIHGLSKAADLGEKAKGGKPQPDTSKGMNHGKVPSMAGPGQNNKKAKKHRVEKSMQPKAKPSYEALETGGKHPKSHKAHKHKGFKHPHPTQDVQHKPAGHKHSHASGHEHHAGHKHAEKTLGTSAKARKGMNSTPPPPMGAVQRLSADGHMETVKAKAKKKQGTNMNAMKTKPSYEAQETGGKHPQKHSGQKHSGQKQHAGQKHSGQKHSGQKHAGHKQGHKHAGHKQTHVWHKHGHTHARHSKKAGHKKAGKKHAGHKHDGQKPTLGTSVKGGKPQPDTSKGMNHGKVPSMAGPGQNNKKAKKHRVEKSMQPKAKPSYEALETGGKHPKSHKAHKHKGFKHPH